MEAFSKIVDPITGDRVNIHTKLGMSIINQYQQRGGNYSMATSLKHTNTLVFCHGNIYILQFLYLDSVV